MINFDAQIQTSRGHHQSFDFALVDDETVAPVNLAGYTLEATFRERGAAPLLLTTTSPAKIFAVDPPSGVVTLVIEAADTLLLPSRDIHSVRYTGSIPYTCICQIDGLIGGRRYLLATVAIDNISSAVAGETA